MPEMLIEVNLEEARKLQPKQVELLRSLVSKCYHDPASGGWTDEDARNAGKMLNKLFKNLCPNCFNVGMMSVHVRSNEYRWITCPVCNGKT